MSNTDFIITKAGAFTQDAVERLVQERDQLREALEYVAHWHHRTSRPSRLHDPENIESFRDCPCLTCAKATAALRAENERLRLRDKMRDDGEHHLLGEIEARDKEIELLRKALRNIASDSDQWCGGQCGDAARAALAEIGEINRG